MKNLTFTLALLISINASAGTLTVRIIPADIQQEAARLKDILITLNDASSDQDVALACLNFHQVTDEQEANGKKYDDVFKAFESMGGNDYLDSDDVGTLLDTKCN